MGSTISKTSKTLDTQASMFIEGEKPNRQVYMIMPDESKILFAVEYPNLGFKKIVENIDFEFQE